MAQQHYDLEPSNSIVDYRLYLQSRIAETALFLARNPHLSEAHQAYNEVIRDVLSTDEELRNRNLRAPTVEKYMDDIVPMPILRLVPDVQDVVPELVSDDSHTINN